MTEQEVLEVLAKTGAVITNSHIVYTSGRHGNTYINKDAIYPDTEETSRFCLAIAEHFKDIDVEVVIGPEKGGIILQTWTAYHLTRLTGRKVLGVYAEKVEGKAEEGEKFIIRRGYDKIISGKKVLIVEDVLTTGGSVRKVVEAVRSIGGNVVGLGVLCNRGGITPKEVGDVPELFALVNIKLDSWNETEYPFCAQKVLINTDVGKGREFLSRQSNI